MFNLIKLEFYKLKRQDILKVLLLIVIGISAFSAFSEIRILMSDGLRGSGKEGYTNGFRDMFMLFVSGIFAGFYIGSDFSNKTIQSQLFQGYKRLDIIISKALVFFIGTSIIMLLYPITVSIIYTFKYGWGEPFTITSVLFILRVAALGIILNVGTTSIFVLLAFLCKDIPKTICTCFAFPVLISAISSTLGKAVPVIGDLLRFTTLAQMGSIIDDIILPSTVLTVFLTAMITVIIVISLANLLFAKAEVK
ncbi:ABC transporter permease [Tissierella sp. MB52-C2]|uniref:ABC transporter permease n=1 Tax=Tissierella sp. MB52-C2 TaxID=3070999 RepID=UPI00280A9549|nr:ABC transporter permease [Tissierella sp. MB52-C2]WMM23297.1 ABC transporter permease [Tissierella sp. MB52-C2]